MFMEIIAGRSVDAHLKLIVLFEKLTGDMQVLKICIITKSFPQKIALGIVVEK